MAPATASRSGDDVAFSGTIEVRAFNLIVSIGDSVWLAGEAAMLNGARLPNGCGVGFLSIVTGAFDEPDCVLAGLPARVFHRGTAWTR